MANILNKTAQIRNAIHGKDVRESLASGIEAISDQQDLYEQNMNIAENTRVNSENTRQTNESNRVSAENIRTINEQQRITNEDTREGNETTRIANESSRLSEFQTILNQVVSDFNIATETSQGKQVISLVKHGSFTAAQDNTTIFQVDLSLYNPITDFVYLTYKNLPMQINDNYTMLGGEVTLNFPLSTGEIIYYDIIKIVNNEPIQSDGSNLMDGSITLMKFAQDIQYKLNRTPYMFDGGDFGDTTSTGLVINGGDF